MKRRSASKRAGQTAKFWQILIILLGFVLIFVAKIDVFAIRSAQTSTGNVFGPLFEVVTAPLSAVETMVDGVRTAASLREETIRLRAENERLKRWQRRSEILESENRQLRTVLGAVIPPDREAVTARAIAAPGNSFSHTLMVRHGYDSRIRRGDPVVTADGLVGYLIDVGREFSWVLLISDVNSRIPVLLSSSSWPGLAVGRNARNLDLGFLPLEAQPRDNELVLTSGHGEVLPAGLPVGRVNSGGTSRKYTIEPVVDLRKVSFVSILVRPSTEEAQNISGFDRFYTPLPESDQSRLLEGVTAKDVLQ